MPGQYYINPEAYSLVKFQCSLESRELIPSRQLLRQNLEQNFNILHASGIKTIAVLLSRLKSKSKISEFAEQTGISVDYLTLLRREAKSYFPAPVKLARFIGVDQTLISKLEDRGINSSKKLYELAANQDHFTVFLEESGICISDLSVLISLSDLSRLYGVGPTFAAVLFEAGIDSTQTLMKYTGEQIRSRYEERTQRKADFTSRDIDFTLEIAKELESIR